MVPQPGLKWVLNKCYEAEPTWTHDPKVEIIVKLARQHLHFKDEDKCTADYFMQGAFNRVYLIRCPRGGEDEQTFIFRVSLPVDPGFKVSSDVATMTFVRDYTDAPVPQVLAFDPSDENELGFAWTIMEMMPGRTLCQQWRYMNWKQKESLAKRIAGIVAQMFRHKFRGIGNLYQTADALSHRTNHRNIKPNAHLIKNDSTNILPARVGLTQDPPSNDIDEKWHMAHYEVGRIVSMSFLWHNRVHYDVFRGPFACSSDWLAARLAFVITESAVRSSDSSMDQRRKNSANKYSSIARRLEKQLPNFFPVNSSCPDQEVTTLHHYDTSGYNVLVDREGRLTALLDWDGVSTVPLWKACQMPEFLMSRYIDELGESKLERNDQDCIATRMSRDEAISLEKTQLRASFLTEMERIEPQWVEIHKTSRRLADFEKAVQLCDSLFVSDLVNEWLSNIEQGKECWSLQQRLLEG